MELWDIDFKVEDEDATMILLVFFPMSYKNLMSYLSIRKGNITLEEVKFSLYIRKFYFKAFTSADDKKFKKSKQIMNDLRDVCKYYK